MSTTGDAGLPELIEADGRLRLRLRRQLTLDRYLKGIPDLADRGDALDAAIDMTLRAVARTGRPDDDAVNGLIEQYHEFGTEIRDAAALNNALWSTEQVRRYFTTAPIKTLPSDFGPSLADGVQRYELRELLGEGAFGQVYLAVDRQLSEAGHPALVSIKLLSRGNSSLTRRPRPAASRTRTSRRFLTWALRPRGNTLSSTNTSPVATWLVGLDAAGASPTCDRRRTWWPKSPKACMQPIWPASYIAI